MSFKYLLTLAFVALTAAHHEAVNSRQQVLVKKLYDSIITPEYNPNVRPYGLNGTEYTHVTVQVRDINVINVDPTRGTFTFQGYFRKLWTDPRLAYNDTSVSYIPVRECKSIWVPDLFFYQGVQTGEFPTSYHSPARVSRIYPDGRVFQSCFHTQTIYCPYIYRKDIKEFTCTVRLGSYGYFSDELQVFFREGQGLSTVSNGYLPNFTFNGVTASTCDTVKARSDDVEHKHSCVQADFKFTRA